MSQSSLAAKARYRERHREMLRERNREYHKRKPEMKTRYRKINREAWRMKHRVWEHNRRARVRNAEGSFTVQEWLDVCAKHDNRCAHCGLQVELTQDHIIPLARGGTNWISNIQPLCRICNSRKHAKMPDEIPAAGGDSFVAETH